MTDKFILANYTPIETYKMVLNGDIIKFPRGFWNKDRAIEISKYLFEDILEWKTKEDIELHLTFKLLVDYKLDGMMNLFTDTVSNLLKEIYPNYFNSDYRKFSQSSCWNDKENVKLVVRHLIEDKYKWSKEEIKKNFSRKMFTENRFITILNHYTLYEVLDFTYPGEYLKWDLFMETWKEEDYRDAIKWFVEIKLKWSKEQVIDDLKGNTFIVNSLASIVPIRFKNVYDAISFAYPDENWEELKERVNRQRYNRKLKPKCVECESCFQQDIEGHIKKYLCTKNKKRIYQKELSRNSPMWCPKREG